MVRLKFTTILIGIIFLTSCLSTALSDGSDTIIKEVPNAKMNKKAILFLREAGTTVDNSYQVSIIDFNSKFDTTSVGNTFTVDADHNQEVSLRPEIINLKWTSNDTLTIEYNRKLRTFIKNKDVNNIKILYVPR